MSISTISTAAPTRFPTLISSGSAPIPLVFVKGSAHSFKSPAALSLSEMSELLTAQGERIEHLEAKLWELSSRLKLEDAKARPFISIREALALYLPVSEKTVRWWIWNSTDGFADLITKRGRRLWINREALIRWIDAGGMRYVQSRG